jgi:hypothetical protein
VEERRREKVGNHQNRRCNLPDAAETGGEIWRPGSSWERKKGERGLQRGGFIGGRGLEDGLGFRAWAALKSTASRGAVRAQGSWPELEDGLTGRPHLSVSNMREGDTLSG